MDHFALLGLSRDASRLDVRSAYHRLMLKHHPDKQEFTPRTEFDAPQSAVNGHAISSAADDRPNHMVLQLNEAYRVLSDDLSRKEYLEALKARHDSGRADRIPKAARQDRPMRIISLSEFTPHYGSHPTHSPVHSATSGQLDALGVDSPDGPDDIDAEPTRYTHPCRCSATLEITTAYLEEGVDVIGCAGCGERVGVGYEVVDETSDGDGGGDGGGGEAALG